MKKFLILLGLILIATCAHAQGYHRVRGHYRRDGTYVQPHYRTNPNHTSRDNWSTRGNVNPFTGQRGTQDPDRNPFRYNPNNRSSWY